MVCCFFVSLSFENLHLVHDRTRTHTQTLKRVWQLWVLCEMPRRRHLKIFFIHKNIIHTENKFALANRANRNEFFVIFPFNFLAIFDGNLIDLRIVCLTLRRKFTE